ncbi:MAG: hypothetical protein DRJ60_04795 [Thermoprotei archaeon]|nr:MAG: hypothetical protein DRJ60_04795 [Thermoprotei archaeon]
MKSWRLKNLCKKLRILISRFDYPLELKGGLSLMLIEVMKSASAYEGVILLILQVPLLFLLEERRLLEIKK